MSSKDNNLNQSISRAGTHAEKYDLRKTVFGTDDVLPMWVADMDLPTPPFVLNAIHSRLNHPILGYTHTPDSVYQAIIDWQAQHNYQVQQSHIVFTHNVANGFFMAVSAFTQPGDAVLVQPPIYPPFLSAPQQNNRVVIESPLILSENHYEIDFDAFEKAIVDNSVKLFLFCSPQNPSGRVWLETELRQLADICQKHNVIIVSDEIHSDMVYAPNKHIPIASLSEEIANNVVTLSSPGKTFNLGGLQIGYAIISNPKLKADYLKICKQNSIDSLNLFAQIALTAAYTEQGKQWRNELLSHFSENIDILETFFAKEFPKVRVMRPQASYLVWLDFKEMFASQAELKDWLIHKAKLGLNDGESFGGESQAGANFMRINLAVAQPVLNQALQQLKQAKHSLPVE
ncbi:MAG TPA: pyridoxal phosphate-dependent aminotransferase [Thiomicrospira sp.]|jgi:cystathionine beta-lyase|nr:pyridoxal phosphate-dependent aminotransferase [Thiomicrospira sp.]